MRFRWKWPGKSRFLMLLSETLGEWMKHRTLRLGAALAFYTVLSLPPLLVVVLSITGLVFGREAAQDRLVAQFGNLLGAGGRRFFDEMLSYASRPREGILASSLGLVVLCAGVSGVFGHLQDALNAIWETPGKEHAGFVGFLKNRFLSFNVVAGGGFLLLVSLVVSAALAGLGERWWGSWKALEAVLHAMDLALSFVVITILFAMLFKFLPDARVRWRDVWIGAAMTSLLFTLGKLAIGFYLGRSKVGSAYGAAGSLVLLMLWVYYSAQIFFLGAEFTRVHARAQKEGRVPTIAPSPAKEASRSVPA